MNLIKKQLMNTFIFSKEPMKGTYERNLWMEHMKGTYAMS